MKKQKFQTDLSAIQDQDLIESFDQFSSVNTDDFLLLNRALFAETEEECYY